MDCTGRQFECALEFVYVCQSDFQLVCTRYSVGHYPLLEKSSLTPQGYVFPIVWTVLYILMGLGLADVVRRRGEGFETAVFLWVICQLNP